MPRPTNDAMIEREEIAAARAAGAEIRTLQSPPAPPTFLQRLMGHKDKADAEKRTLTGGKKRRTRIIKNSKKRKIKAKKTKKAKIRTKKR